MNFQYKLKKRLQTCPRHNEHRRRVAKGQEKSPRFDQPKAANMKKLVRLFIKYISGNKETLRAREVNQVN